MKINVRRCTEAAREAFYKKVVLKNFTKFTEKPLRQSVFVNKVTGLRLQFLN